MLVLLDNGTAEYSFIINFFSSPEPIRPPVPTSSLRPGLSPRNSLLLSPAPVVTEFEDAKSNGESELAGNAGVSSPKARLTSINSVLGFPSPAEGTQPLPNGKEVKDEQNAMNAIWKQVMDPVLAYCEVCSNTRPLHVTILKFFQTFVGQILAPHPTVPLLTMIRLTEEVMLEVQKRNCPPLETFIFSTRLKMWPVWQKGMGDHLEGVRKLVEGPSGAGALGAMWRKNNVSETTVKAVR